MKTDAQFDVDMALVERDYQRAVGDAMDRLAGRMIAAAGLEAEYYGESEEESGDRGDDQEDAIPPAVITEEEEGSEEEEQAPPIADLYAPPPRQSKTIQEKPAPLFPASNEDEKIDTEAKKARREELDKKLQKSTEREDKNEPPDSTRAKVRELYAKGVKEPKVIGERLGLSHPSVYFHMDALGLERPRRGPRKGKLAMAAVEEWGAAPDDETEALEEFDFR